MLKPDDGGPFDALVVGAGPAGLSAAVCLARYRRRVALFDAGGGRSSWHQINHDYLGFPGGVPARRLRELGREQVARYPEVSILDRAVDQLEQVGAVFRAGGRDESWSGRTVILCTGVEDNWPRFEGWEHYVGRSMFWCLSCDGYCSRGDRLVVAGNTDNAAVEALQLRRFTETITMLTDGDEQRISPQYSRLLAQAGIPLIHDRIAAAVGVDGQLEALLTHGGRRIALDRLFSLHGAMPKTELARTLGVALDSQGYVLVDAEQKTNCAGVYAAGDITAAYPQQVAAAVHEGSQAASAANYYLYPAELRVP